MIRGAGSGSDIELSPYHRRCVRGRARLLSSRPGIFVAATARPYRFPVTFAFPRRRLRVPTLPQTLAVTISSVIVLLCTLLAALAPGRTSTGDPGDVGAFSDATMAAALRKYHSPGGVLVIVKDGRVVLAKGYGLADVERRIPMDAATTGLRVASVSKAVTATAVMQLVDQGHLSLDADVNRYLRTFQIAATFPEPVRVRHLLTHTAGFDERFTGAVARSPVPAQPLGAYLSANMPARLSPPGQQWLYSNHGITLAGHLVELVSGEPFSEYMARHVFAPLGMTATSFVLTPDVEARLATGYINRSGAEERWQMLYTNLRPAAALTTTGADMARFMVAHLEGGATDTGRIMRPETLHLMHERHFAVDSRAAGMALGFFEHFRNGARGLLHDGDWAGYSSRLLLVPQSRLGVFVSFNTWNAELRADVVGRIVDHYVPPRGETVSNPARQIDFVPNAQAVAGTYRSNRYPHLGLMKLMALGSETRIVAVDDRTLEVDGLRYAASEPGLFRRIDGHGRIIVRHVDGRVSQVMIESPVVSGFVLLEPVPWYGTREFQRMLSLCLRSVAATSVVWIVMLPWIRKRGPAVPKAARRARMVASVAALPLAANPYWVMPLMGALGYGLSPMARGLLFVPVLMAFLAGMLGYYTLLAWRRKFWSPAGRIQYTAVAVSVALYVCVLAYWNLLRIPF